MWLHTVPDLLPRDDGWVGKLRKVSLYLYAAIPLPHLISRTNAEIMIGVITISFLAVVISQKWWVVLRVPPVAILIVTWVVLIAVITPLGVDVPPSLIRSLHWIRFICLFAAAAFWLIREDRDLKIVVLAWGAVMALLFIDGVYQHITGMSITGQPLYYGQRLTGPLDRPNLGNFTVRLIFPVLAATLVLGARGLGPGWRMLPVPLTAAALAFITLTADRGAILLALMAIATACAGLILFFPRYRLAGFAGGIGALAIVGTIVALVPRLGRRADSLREVAGGFGESHYGEVIAAAIEVWKTSPLTGVGLRNFQTACQMQFEGRACVSHAHNIYVEWLADAGLIGIALFLGFLVMVIVFVLRAARALVDRPLASVFLPAALMVTMFPFVATQSFFSNWPAILWWNSLTLTMAAAVHALRRRSA